MNAQSETPRRIASIGDEPEAHELVSAALQPRGLGPTCRSTWSEALAGLPGGPPAVVLAYIRDLESSRAAQQLLAELGSTPMLLLGRREMMPELARLVGAGARDYLMRPFSPAELVDRVTRALRPARPPAGRALPVEGLIGESQSFLRVLEQIRLVAGKEASVLITGETGVGKERVAQALHRLSHRSSGPLVAVNCAGIPAPLLEDEFFGHEKGAFTDAYRARVGRFEQARGGTIFLDEIGDLPLELQPKLLRVLQEREVHRLGGADPIPVDARVIAATNTDLSAAVGEGRIREDLFYRINVFPIHVPPLRERPNDIPLFAEHFLERYCRRERLPQKRLAPEAEADLMTRPWRGNIRELENAVEIAAIQSLERRIVAIGDFRPSTLESITPILLDPTIDCPINLRTAVLRFEHDLIRRALDGVSGNKTQAAEALSMKRTTLIEKVHKLDRELAGVTEPLSRRTVH